MSISPAQVELVTKLPRQLLSFFARYPPASATSWSATSDGSTDYQSVRSNPFRSTRNEHTQKYNEPRYSLRRQTDLYNLAKLHSVEHLLPPRAPHKEMKVGDVMKGLKRWKGTKSERTRDIRLEAIKVKSTAAQKVMRTRQSRTKAKKKRLGAMR